MASEGAVTVVGFKLFHNVIACGLLYSTVVTIPLTPRLFLQTCFGMGTHSSWYHSPHPVQDTILPPSCVRHFVILPFTGLQGYKLCVRMLTTAGEERAREESARLQTLRENAENRRRRESSRDRSARLQAVRENAQNRRRRES